MSIYEKLWALPIDLKEKITKAGDYLQKIIPITTLLVALVFMPHHFVWVYVGYFAVVMALMSLLKAMFNNPRPREVGTDDNPDLDLDWSPDEGNTFVSGHSSAGFGGALPAFWINPWLGAVLFVLACFVGFSRVVAKAHWIRDVVGAFVLAAGLWWVAVYFFL